MKNILQRSIFGLLYVALIVGAILGGPEYFTPLMALFAALAINEFHNLDGKPCRKSVRVLDMVTGAILILPMGIMEVVEDCDELTLLLVTAFYATILLIYMLIRLTMAVLDKGENVVESVSRSALAFLYIVLPLTFASLLSYFNSKTNVLLVMFVMIWLNDTGAYCVGCSIGKHRLCERLSPKKSWEGFWGGLVFSALTGVVVGYFYVGATLQNIVFWTVLGVVIGTFASIGDLFESMLKRNAGVKDSGHLIPGHGGMLDRIDSLLFVAPATIIYIFLFLSINLFRM